MKKFVVLGSLTLILGSVCVSSNAQSATTDPLTPPASERRVRDYSAVINDMFAPITEKLNLTREQQFQIIAIITETEVRSSPLVHSLLTADQELSELAFSGPVDENTVTRLSGNEASMIGEMIKIKVKAKANIFRLLTPEQRALVAEQFRDRVQLEGQLGSISIY